MTKLQGCLRPRRQLFSSPSDKRKWPATGECHGPLFGRQDAIRSDSI